MILEYTYTAILLAATDSVFFDSNLKYYPIFNRINTLIQEAWDSWDSWDDEHTIMYWNSKEKPPFATKEFKIDWLDNYDFSADGWNEDLLNEELKEFYYLT